jgi:kalirin
MSGKDKILSFGISSSRDGFRSVGVVMYTLLSGLSPFLDETEEQTCANILNIDFNFPESQFPHAFQAAKNLIQTIFVRDAR